jgi:hypothetical protein
VFTSIDWDGKEIETSSPDIHLGYTQAIPRETLAAWGARAIVSGPAYLGDGSFDLVGDRKAFSWQDGVAKRKLARHLDTHVIHRMKERYKELRSEGAIRCDREDEVVLYEDRRIKAVGNTNASCGYFYLAAWLKPQTIDKLSSVEGHLDFLREQLGALPTEEEGRCEQMVETYLGCVFVLKYLQCIAEELDALGVGSSDSCAPD